jgi:exodeoxyribonuclease VII large subunit
VLDRARLLARLSRAPAEHVSRHRARLHQQARELRASTRRGLADEQGYTRARAGAIERRALAAATARERAVAREDAVATALERTASAALGRHRRDLDRLALALAAHDPQRTLERGYALVQRPGGAPVTSAQAARGEAALWLRFHDGQVGVRSADGSPGGESVRPDAYCP